MRVFTQAIILIFGLLLLSVKAKAQANYPIPSKTNKLMFYIQRNHNSNTIVYEANFNSKGDLDSDEALLVSWIRYDEQGQRMPLRRIERWYAFGFECKAIDSLKNSYSVELVAYDKRKLLLTQTGNKQAKIYIDINHQRCVLDHLYIQADNSSLWPKVKYIEIFGKNAQTGQKEYEKILNKN